MKLFFQILAEFGLPVAAALIMGFFIYLIIKYILESVVGQVKTMHAIITMLDNRVKTMNHDMIKLVANLCNLLKHRFDFSLHPNLA